MEQHVWRVRSGRVTVKHRDGKEARYAPGQEFVCDEQQLSWRREQVEYLRPADASEAPELKTNPEPAQPELKTNPDSPEATSTTTTESGDQGESPSGHRVKPRGGGWYDVVDAGGNRVNDAPLRRPDAKALAGTE